MTGYVFKLLHLARIELSQEFYGIKRIYNFVQLLMTIFMKKQNIFHAKLVTKVTHNPIIWKNMSKLHMKVERNCLANCVTKVIHKIIISKFTWKQFIKAEKFLAIHATKVLLNPTAWKNTSKMFMKAQKQTSQFLRSQQKCLQKIVILTHKENQRFI